MVIHGALYYSVKRVRLLRFLPHWAGGVSGEGRNSEGLFTSECQSGTATIVSFPVDDLNVRRGQCLSVAGRHLPDWPTRRRSLPPADEAFTRHTVNLYDIM